MKKSKKLNILITNDDGIHAPGIRHLWNALKDFAHLTIVAPSIEQSGVGLGITIRNPLRLTSVNGLFDKTPAWSLSGTPADCVKMALKVVLDEKPDIIVSGINRGSNAGQNLLYSGTVAGVIEGTLQGISGIAFSCYDYVDPNYEQATPHVINILQHALEHPLPSGTLLNVNFPSSKNAGKIRGYKMTRQGKEYWVENPEKRIHPAEEHDYYWLGAKLGDFEEHQDSDIAWLRQGYVTAVPVHVAELTDHAQLKKRQSLFDKDF